MQHFIKSRNRVTLWLDHLIPDGGNPTEILDKVLDSVPESPTAGIAPVPTESSPRSSQLRGTVGLDPLVCVSDVSESCAPVDKQLLFQIVPSVSQLSPIVWQNAAGNHCCANGDVPHAGARSLFHAKPNGQLSFVFLEEVPAQIPSV